MHLLAAGKRQEVLGGNPATLDVPRELREGTGVDRREFAVVLLRRLAVDNPLTGVQACDRGVPRVERHETVRGSGARSGGWETVPLVSATVGVPRESVGAETSTGCCVALAHSRSGAVGSSA